MWEDMLPQFDNTTRVYVIGKIIQRALLCTVLFIVIGIWFFMASPFKRGDVGEISFLFFYMIAMIHYYTAVSFSQKKLEGDFGKTLLDIFKIEEMLQEEKHWWGRRIF